MFVETVRAKIFCSAHSKTTITLLATPIEQAPMEYLLEKDPRAPR